MIALLQRWMFWPRLLLHQPWRLVSREVRSLLTTKVRLHQTPHVGSTSFSCAMLIRRRVPAMRYFRCRLLHSRGLSSRLPWHRPLRAGPVRH